MKPNSDLSVTSSIFINLEIIGHCPTDRQAVFMHSRASKCGFSMTSYWLIFINLDTGKLTYVGIQGLFYQSEFDRLGNLLDLTIFEWPDVLNSMRFTDSWIQILQCLKPRRTGRTYFTECLYPPADLSGFRMDGQANSATLVRDMNSIKL